MGSKRFARLIGGVALACSTLALATPPITAPAWRDLTPAQQRTLAPLAKEWQDLPDESGHALISGGGGFHTASRAPPLQS